jgi:hypothetical protein
MGPDELIDEWRRGLRISHRAHYEAAKYYHRQHLALTLPTVIISALLGTSVFANLQYADVALIKISMSILSLATVALTSVQGFLRSAERSERHKTAAVQIGEVRRALEQQLVFTHRDEPTIATLRKKWDAADRQAPTIPSRIYDRAAALVRSLGDRPAGQQPN